MFIKKLIRNIFFKYLRNFIGYRPSYFLIDYEKTNMSISDAFFWRTDKSFKTIFKFTDILKLYLNDNTSMVEILFFSKGAKLIKTINIRNIELNNKLVIDKSFLGGLEDYGTFFIYHKSFRDNVSSIRNSCYTGYSYMNNLPSYVHGNTLTSIKSFDGKVIRNLIGGISFFKKQTYKVQNIYKHGTTEILLMNPCNSKIVIYINRKIYHLDKGNSKLIKISGEELISIKSKSYLLRPIVFNYRNNYLDVHHG